MLPMGGFAPTRRLHDPAETRGQPGAEPEERARWLRTPQSDRQERRPLSSAAANNPAQHEHAGRDNTVIRRGMKPSVGPPMDMRRRQWYLARVFPRFT